eukprot:TRINITY_DN2822_c0_g1_i1.p1 TRINITY_DN2822_c0_g1~~TRINITY_DN2822_c0_g1_i1.p1  ORF type:complete len:219 (-),score=78.77 TRINITY_DN2822_c0_g1_i1:136-792(-)
MNKLFSLFCLVIIFNCFNCESLGDRCRETPPRFHGQFALILLKNGGVNIREIGTFYSDCTSKQARADIQFNGTQVYSVWIDYSNSIEYVLDRNTNECFTQHLYGPTITNKIPDNAVAVDSINFAGSIVQPYFFKSASPNLPNVSVELLVEVAGCQVISATFFDTLHNSVIGTQSFWNLVPYVPPYTFDLPSQCKSSSTYLRKSNPTYQPLIFDPIFSY